ncbi:MAG: phosphatidylinositol mannoside acyltransferase, partial [Nocardioidaceae bacterium]
MSLTLTSRDRLVDYAFRAGWAVTRHAPEEVSARVLENAADRMWRRRTKGVVQLEANLRRARPDADEAALRALSQQALRSYFRYWHEAFRMSTWSAGRIVDSVVTTNEAAQKETFAEGNGGIIALPHMANWDHAGAWACLTGRPVSAVAERLRPDSLFDQFVAYREELGMEIVALTGAENALTAMEDALARRRLVCLLADRDLTRSGAEVTLLGEQATLPTGAAVLAQRTGAPLIAMTLRYRGPLMHVVFSDPVEVRPGRDGAVAMTQDIADHFSLGIRAAPYDWHMLQRV